MTDTTNLIHEVEDAQKILPSKNSVVLDANDFIEERKLDNSVIVDENENIAAKEAENTQKTSTSKSCVILDGNDFIEERNLDRGTKRKLDSGIIIDEDIPAIERKRHCSIDTNTTSSSLWNGYFIFPIQKIEKPQHHLLVERPFYKPMPYSWCHESWLQQMRVHWLAEEVMMIDDIKDYNAFNAVELNCCVTVMRSITQNEMIVGTCYMREYASVFKPYEVAMMLSCFAAMEANHTEAYAYLLDSLGLPEVEYKTCMECKEISEKFDFLGGFDCKSIQSIATTLAVFGGLVEGAQLFGIFATLLNYQRFGKMRGMGQILAWSMRDETLHSNSIIKLWHAFVKENHDEIDFRALGEYIIFCAKKMIELEDNYIDLVFEMGPVYDLTPQLMKRYMRYIVNYRLSQIYLRPVFDEKINPLPWMDDILNAMEHSNFFETRPTEYSKASTQGDWSEVFLN